MLAESLARLKDPARRLEAQRLAAAHGLNPVELLRTRRNGFVITVTPPGFVRER